MTPTDKPQFVQVLRATMSLYNREVANDALHLWWGALEHLPIEAVTKALQAHIQGEGGHFAPLPADVIKATKAASGHPSPDEAWAIAVSAQDEYESVLWTRQIAEASGIADPILATGDKVGARMAFLSAYERITKEGPPSWFISLGIDQIRREIVIDKALRLGRIDEGYARQIMPPESNMVLTPAGLLPAPERTQEQVANGLAILAQLKASFGVIPDEA